MGRKFCIPKGVQASIREEASSVVALSRRWELSKSDKGALQGHKHLKAKKYIQRWPSAQGPFVSYLHLARNINFKTSVAVHPRCSLLIICWEITCIFQGPHHLISKCFYSFVLWVDLSTKISGSTSLVPQTTKIKRFKKNIRVRKIGSHPTPPETPRLWKIRGSFNFFNPYGKSLKKSPIFIGYLWVIIPQESLPRTQGTPKGSLWENRASGKCSGFTCSRCKWRHLSVFICRNAYSEHHLITIW